MIYIVWLMTAFVAVALGLFAVAHIDRQDDEGNSQEGE